MTKYILSLTFALASTAMANTIIFTDDFSGATTGLDAGAGAVPGWTITPSIDVVSPGLYGITSCHSETHCVDTDGSNGAAGSISRTVPVFAGLPYLLTWWSSGSQRDPVDYYFASPTATMRVSIGAVSTDLVLPWDQPWGAWAMPYTPLVDELVTITFTGSPNAYVGLLLDDVSFIDSTNSTHTPEPATLGLAIIGLVIILVGRRRN